MKHILITGITGFLGANLVQFLSVTGHMKIVGYSRSPLSQHPGLEKYDITWIDDLSADSFDKNRIDVIVHLAGIAHDISGVYSPNDYHEVNYLMTARLYDAFAQSSVSKFFFISSVKAAVEHASGVITEMISPSPGSEYGKSKLAAERYISSMTLKEGKRYYIFRPCMIHGAGNKGNLNLLFKFVKTGIPYPLGAFENRRSYLSVDNFNFVMERFIERDFPSGIFNMSDSGSISTNELVSIIAEARGGEARIVKVPKAVVKAAAAIGSALGLPFNNSRLSKLTGEMVVSNEKLLSVIGEDLPVTLKEGLSKSIKSFS